jgi:APA family basic amino acid/polyamine antiporter
MVVTQVVGVGIFLTPALMIRALGSTRAAFVIWAVMGTLSIAGAICYAELTTRFPTAGGGYVFLREGFGARSAFVFGWMALLVMDPGITAALGIGFAQYLLAAFGARPDLVPVAALATTVAFGVLTLAGVGASAAVLRWTAIAKFAIVAILVGAAAIRVGAELPVHANAAAGVGRIGMDAIAASFIAAFFAFGGWWELGRMSEEVESPRRTMPRALIGGLVLVTAIYAAVSLAYVMSAPTAVAGTDEAFVAIVGAALFGPTAGRLLALMVAIAVSGSLAATLLAAPRMYLAMSRDGLLPPQLAHFDERRGAAPALTLIQVSLACLLILLGSFDQILGYFVPVTVFFLALSAAAILRLPRPAAGGEVFRAPLHPVPILLFLFLMVSVMALFLIGQPTQTLLGAAVAAAGVPISFLFINRGGNAGREDARRM